MNCYLCNGISESMKTEMMKQISYNLSESEFIELIEKVPYISCIGHYALADYLSILTGRDIVYANRGITVNSDDLIILVNMRGRLPEKPTRVEYRSRLMYKLIRFEKQSLDDLKKSQDILEELLCGVEA